jgi:hypothetical protein
MKAWKDNPFIGFAVGLAGGLGDALFTEQLDGGVEVPGGVGEGLFAVHHARVGFVAEFFNE